MPLVEKAYDRRDRGRRNTAIFVPVGELAQLEIFLGQVKRLGLENGNDFIFLFRKGLKVPDVDISAICYSEAAPLGTSGAFFEGQRISYGLGYKTVVVADTDAFLDSRKTFDALIEIAERTGKVAVPISMQKENEKGNEYIVINQWGAIPVGIFNDIGFCTPYMWRGGEDYEFKQRLISRGLFEIYRKGSVEHPIAGYTIYHKMVQPRKFYPYVNGLLKAMLFESGYSKPALLKYAAWSIFYSFFADAFQDRQLERVIKESHKFQVLDWVNEENPPFAISKIRERAAFSTDLLSRSLNIPLSFGRLMVTGKADMYTDRVELRIPRSEMVINSIVAVAMTPIRVIQLAQRLMEWKNESKKVIFPVMPQDAEKAEKIYAMLVKKGSL